MSTKPTPLARLSRAAEAMGMTRSTKAQLGEFTGADARRFNRNCGQDAKCRKRWVRIANAVMDRTGDKVQSIKVANAKAPALSRPTGRKAQMGGVKDTWKPSRDDPFADFAPTEATVNRWASWQPTDVNPDAQKEAGETLRGSYGLSAPAAQMGQGDLKLREEINGGAVSTVSMPPGVTTYKYETMVTINNDEVEQVRHNTRDEALAAHQAMIAKWKDFPTDRHVPNHLRPYGASPILRPHGFSTPSAPAAQLQGDGGPDDPAPTVGEMRSLIQQNEARMPYSSMRPGDVQMSSKAQMGQGLDPDSLDSDTYYTLWQQRPSGYWIIERSFPGHYIKNVYGSDIKADNKWGVFPQGQDPNPQQGELFATPAPGAQMSRRPARKPDPRRAAFGRLARAAAKMGMKPKAQLTGFPTRVGRDAPWRDSVASVMETEDLVSGGWGPVTVTDIGEENVYVEGPDVLNPRGGYTKDWPGQWGAPIVGRSYPRHSDVGDAMVDESGFSAPSAPAAQLGAEYYPQDPNSPEVWEGIRDALSDDVDWTRRANMQDHEWRMREARAGKGHGPGFSAPSAPAARMGWDVDAEHAEAEAIERSRERSRNPHGRSRYPANPAIGPGVQPSPAGYSDPWLANTAYGLFGAATEQEAREIYESGFSAPSAPAAQLGADWQKEKEVDDIMNLLSETPAQRREREREIDATMEEAFRVEPRFSAPAAALQPPLSKPMAPKFPEDARSQKAMAAKLFAGLQGAAVKAVARQFARNHRKAGFRLAFTVARGQLAPLRRAMSASKPQTRSQQARRKA